MFKGIFSKFCAKSIKLCWSLFSARKNSHKQLGQKKLVLCILL